VERKNFFRRKLTGGRGKAILDDTGGFFLARGEEKENRLEAGALLGGSKRMGGGLRKKKGAARRNKRQVRDLKKEKVSPSYYYGRRSQKGKSLEPILLATSLLFIKVLRVKNV